MLMLVLGAIFIALFWYVAIRPMNYWKKRGVKQGNPVCFFGDMLSAFFKTESCADVALRLHMRFSTRR